MRSGAWMGREPDGSIAALRGRVLAWWYGLPAPLRSDVWPTAIAGLTILALLLGFHSVVTMSVKQGQVLRMAVATQAEALARCRALPNATTRANCLKQLNSPPRVEASRAPPPDAARVAQLER